MATTDTGGLGLLQLLMQAGITPQHLMAMIEQQQLRAHQAALARPDPTQGNADQGVGAPDADGTPGSSGFGGQSVGQVAGNFASGAAQGAASQGAQAAGLPGAAGSVGKGALGMLGTLAGIPTLGLNLVNALFGGAIKVADESLNLQGLKVAPIEFGGPKVVAIPTRGPDPIPLSDALRGRGLEDSGVPATGPVGYPDAAAISAAIAAAGDAGPTGPTGEGPSSGPAGTTGEF